MSNPEILEVAAEILRDVVENGRVLADEDGNLNEESVRVEVEFECLERGILEDCDGIISAAVEMISR